MIILIKRFFYIWVFAESALAATLNCQFDAATCLNFNLSQVTQINEEILVPGAPFEPYVDNSNKSLSFPPFSLQEIPTRLFEIFTNVNSFTAYKISITELGTDSFFNCENLNSIEITNSNIGSIKAGFASTCHSVTTLSFSWTSIQTIDEDAFVGLDKVSTLNLEHCSLSCLPSKIFQPLKSVTSIELNYNDLTALHSQIFAGLTTLGRVNVGYNQIAYIPNFNFDTTGVNNNNILLRLYDNPVKAISPLFMTSFLNGRVFPYLDVFNNAEVAFGGVDVGANTCVPDPHLGGFNGDLLYIGNMNKDIWEQQNSIYETLTTCYSAFTAEMGSDSLTTCATISTTTTIAVGSGSGGQCATDKVCRYYLDWRNDYTCVIDGAEGTVTSITGSHYLTYNNLNVTRLYFVNSFLSVIPSILFETFPNLRYIHAANCGLSAITKRTFIQCGILEFLDLSENEIIKLDPEAWKNCTQLRIVDMTGNPVEIIHDGSYKLTTLERIHFYRDPDMILA